MNGFEVHTAVEQRLPVVWVVLDNGGHGMVHQGDTLMKGRDLGGSLYRVPIDAAAMRTLGRCARRAREEPRRVPRGHHGGPLAQRAHRDRRGHRRAKEVAPTLVKRVETLARFFAQNRRGSDPGPTSSYPPPKG